MGLSSDARTSILIGAGASKEAGLPLTSDLAARLVDALNADSRQGDAPVAALNFVYGAMVGHQAEGGGNPRAAVNIEKLISAVRLLQHRDDHEISPFVSSWKAGSGGFPGLDSEYETGKALLNTLEEFDGSHLGYYAARVEDPIRRLVQEMVSQSNAQAFVTLERTLLLGIADQLRNLKAVDYLAEIPAVAVAQSGGLDVISLNYDLAIETIAQHAGVELETGIARWAPGRPLVFRPRDGRINLYKLHGSLGWGIVGGDAPNPAARAPELREIDADSHMPPWIVVGAREKLSADGPMLALLQAAEQALRRTSRLVVIGYSFADNHINATVRNWMLADSSRTLTIVDPGWPDRLADTDARAQMIARWGIRGEEGKFGQEKSRVTVLKMTAGDALSAGVLRTDFSLPESKLTISVYGDFQAPKIIAHYEGQELRDATLRTTGNGPEYVKQIFAKSEKDERDRRLAESPKQIHGNGLNIPVVRSGDSIELFPSRGPIATNLRLQLTGRALDGRRSVFGSATLQSTP